MPVMTLGIVEKQPAALRGLIGKYLAAPRWQDSCDFYNQMMERERLTICFHAQLKQRHATMRFEEMNDVDRERLVCAIDELRAAFSTGVLMKIPVIGVMPYFVRCGSFLIYLNMHQQY